MSVLLISEEEVSKKPIPIENQEFPEDNFNQDLYEEEHQESFDEFNQEIYDDDVQYEVPEVVRSQKRK